MSVFFNADRDEMYLKVDEVATEAEARDIAVDEAEQWYGDDATFAFGRREHNVPIHVCDDWQDRGYDLDDMDECDATKCGYFDVWTFTRQFTGEPK